MGSKLTLGQYYRADSVLHRMDPRAKLLLTVLYLVIIFFAANWWGYGFIAVFTLIMIRCSGVPLSVVLKSLRPLLFLLAFTFILNLFFTRTGRVLWSWGVLAVTDEGLARSVQLSLRLCFLVAGTSLMTLTTSPIQLTDGLEALLSPLRRIGFPAHEMAMMMTIALRFIPTLTDEADKIMKAQMARGADFESGRLLQRAKAMVPLLVPLFVSAFRRADELAMAMEARCYHGGEGRTRMTVLRAHARDYIAGLAVLAFGAAMLLWGR